MKAKDLREMTAEELKDLVLEQKEKLYKLRFQLELSQLDNTSQIREVKRDIARIKTLIREKELGLQNKKNGSRATSD
ncbi:50S ribosomal protein L29 [Mesoaciditoga lauensis]|uniref:50S ribosomal protein L29 n=1 Tax=Mesoaciditoga lauensis TaxID=1495039 RepID=UPI00055B1650|nr:50S ribosomal protein L29 [Mesoaciditoga lauensis]